VRIARLIVDRRGTKTQSIRPEPIPPVGPAGASPEPYRELVKPFVKGPSVEVMANELDAILGHLLGYLSILKTDLWGDWRIVQDFGHDEF